MLLLWDYNDASSSRLDRCEHQAGPVVDCVGLVKADKSTFAADIDYLLVVCGSVAVDVIGVQYSQGAVRLIETGITVAMPARTRMMQVAGSSSGPSRIFLLGDADNGCIYELRYNVAGWRSYITRDRLEHYLDNLSTSGTIARYLPYMSAGASYRQILVDAEGLLFALTSSGAIELWDTQTAPGSTPTRVDSLNQPLSLARERTYGASPLLSSTRVVALASVTRSESQAVNLIAITDTGARLYLCASLRVQGYYMSPSPSRHIVLKHIRLPPQDVAEVLTRTKRRDIVGRYLSGVFAFALNGDASATLLFSTLSPIDAVSLARRRGENQQTPMSETYSAQNRDGGIVYAIAEEPREAVGTRFASESPLGVSELTSQITSPKPRRFVVLYGDGIQIFTRTTPIETLGRVLGDGASEAIKLLSTRFMDRPQQLCAMDVAIASGFGQVPELALRHMHEYLRHLTDGKAEITARLAIESVDIHVSRLMRAIWRSPVTRPGAILNTLDSAISAPTLRAIQRPLQSLLDEIVSKPAQLGLPELSTMNGGDALADHREKLANLRVLLVQTIQALSFVLLLMDFKLPMIVARAGPSVQSALAGLTYQGLICGRDGREVAKALVTTLINMQTGQQSSIESISNTLQQRCGDFCRSDDVTLYKAWENIRKAKEARSRTDRDEYLQDALALFEQGAGAISLDKARSTCEDFRSLGYATGAITLPLIVAARRDPDAQAYRFYEEGKPEGDSRRAAYDMRTSYYDVVIEQLRAADASDASLRDDCYTVAFRTSDGLFLMHLYSWLIAEGRRDQLLELDRDDMVELYLRDRPASAGDQDLLWRFYARRGRHYMAAIALKDLADGPSELPLDRRVEALALATMHAKSSSTSIDERAPVDFVTELEEQAEVANIQMEIWQAVHEIPEPHRSEALKQLESGLKTVTELWSEFAEPLALYESQLTILKVSDHRDVDLATSVWEELLNQAEGEDVFQASADIIERLGRRLYPSDVAFPVGESPQTLAATCSDALGRFDCPTPPFTRPRVQATTRPRRLYVALRTNLFQRHLERDHITARRRDARI